MLKIRSCYHLLGIQISAPYKTGKMPIECKTTKIDEDFLIWRYPKKNTSPEPLMTPWKAKSFRSEYIKA